MIRTSITALIAGSATLPAFAHHQPGFIPGHPALLLALLAIPVVFGLGVAMRRTRSAKIRRRDDI